MVLYEFTPIIGACFILNKVCSPCEFLFIVAHFFKAGRVLVLYVGDDKIVLNLLKGILGEQFAGR